MSQSLSIGYLISTAIPSTIYHSADMSLEEECYTYQAGVMHGVTREQSATRYSAWKPEYRYGDDRR